METTNTSTSKKSTILMVDDDKFLADMYAMKFTQQGYEVESHLAACDALASLRNGLQPDVVLFDLIMPECDGFAFLDSMHNENLAPKAIKIALTNQSSDAEAARAKELGADAFLVKATLLPSEVVNRVGEELEKHRKA
ncbi:response regulator [Candidatus Kaiserbacteria bacterium]|nr:response regulator [Candidatus Kaiserbacteria bacterium]